MTEAPPKKSPLNWLTLLAAAMAPLLMDSCSSNPKIQGLPDKLPEIALNGSSATPPHNLPGYEYPFDASGNYVTAWAADGERRAGRPASATMDDEKRWSGSHRGHVTAKKTPKKSAKKGSGTSSKKGSGKSSKKKSSSDDDDKPKSKSSSKSSKKGSGTSSKKSSGTSSKKSSGTSSKKKASGSGDSDKPKSKTKPKTKSSGSSSKKKKSTD